MRMDDRVEKALASLQTERSPIGTHESGHGSGHTVDNVPGHTMVDAPRHVIDNVPGCTMPGG